MDPQEKENPYIGICWYIYMHNIYIYMCVCVHLYCKETTTVCSNHRYFR